MSTAQIILWAVVLVACIIYIFLETRKAKPKPRKPMATMNSTATVKTAQDEYEIKVIKKKHPAMQAPIKRNKPKRKTK